MKIMLATKNPGKIKEITKILSSSDIELFSHKDFEIPEVEETGMTFVENALLKARSSSHVTGLPSIADDSGIEVDYLNARPGVMSARYSGEHATNESNNLKLDPRMKDFYKFFKYNEKFIDITDYEEEFLNIFSRVILKEIKDNKTKNWKNKLPEVISEMIIKNNMFGYK